MKPPIDIRLRKFRRPDRRAAIHDFDFPSASSGERVNEILSRFELVLFMGTSFRLQSRVSITLNFFYRDDVTTSGGRVIS